MTPESAAHVVGQMFLTAFWIAAPLLAIGFAAGVIISLIQIVTSIQDSGIAFLGGCLVLMPWMVHKSMDYTIGILGNLHHYAR